MVIESIGPIKNPYSSSEHQEPLLSKALQDNYIFLKIIYLFIYLFIF